MEKIKVSNNIVAQVAQSNILVRRLVEQMFFDIKDKNDIIRLYGIFTDANNAKLYDVTYEDINMDKLKAAINDIFNDVEIIDFIAITVDNINIFKHTVEVFITYTFNRYYATEEDLQTNSLWFATKPNDTYCIKGDTKATSCGMIIDYHLYDIFNKKAL